MPESVLANVGLVSADPNFTVNIALLGFGTVGSCFAEVLHAAGLNNLRITRVFNREVERKRSHPRARFVPEGAVWTENIQEIFEDRTIHVVVEVMGGVEPAGSWLLQALLSNKHVVTANKQLIAQRGPELFAAARPRGLQLLFGASVAGGVPIIPGIMQGIRGDRLRRLSGILNGTCNFILSGMEAGAEYPVMLRRAQELGYAEADPSADVDGFDARAKLCILTRLALQAEIDPSAIAAQSIAQVSAVDFAYAKELGCTIRQVSRAQIGAQVNTQSGHPEPMPTVRARVGPMLVPRDSPIAWSHGTQNMVVTTGLFGGDVVFSGHGAGGHATAVAVLSDVFAVASDSHPVQITAQPHAVSGDVFAPYFLRLVVDDKPGIISAISGALAKHSVNIDSILQRRGYPTHRLPFVVTVEPCLRSTVEAAVAEMSGMGALVEPPLVLEILTVDDPETD